MMTRFRALSAVSIMCLALPAAACAEPAQETEAPATQTETAATEAATPEPAAAEAAISAADAIIAEAGDEAWRDVDHDRLIKIVTEHGDVWVELAPEFAPNHVARMIELAREDFYDFRIWHRVIDGFMAQGGGQVGNANSNSDKDNLESEFTVMRTAEQISIPEIQMRVANPRSAPFNAPAGFWNGFQAGTQPVAQAAIRADGMVESWLLHCKGAAAAARTNDPNSANSQFYITRAEAPHLNAIYTVWGKVRVGQEAIDALAVGTVGQDMGFSPDFIEDMVLAADLAEGERPRLQVIDTNGPAFAAYLDALSAENGGALPDICTIEVPVRIQEG
ncbi:MAG: peptidylprolyl isomerase [Pseudomonadota bacterium]